MQKHSRFVATQLLSGKVYSRHGIDRLTHRTVSEVVKELVDAKTARSKSARYTSDLSSRLKRFAKAHAVISPA